ncbi:MAG: hypothetical protein V4450_04580 [Bacteroidota bacterium]
MKKYNLYLLVLLYCLGYLSCQDKYLMGYTPAATGSLKYDGTSNCLPKTIAGTFIAAKELGDTNYLVVVVNVKTTGTYLVHSNSANGFSFSGSGTFTATGLNQVKLAATGKPIAAGTTDVLVLFDTSSCHVAITVLPVGGAVTPSAVYTFAGAPNACTNVVTAGSFAQGGLLDTSSKVTASVNVTTPGTYTITTNTVNGYSFSGTGVFTTTGIQTVSLSASGTPLAVGINNFTFSANTAGCSFPVTVVSGVAVTNNDHFPLSNGSYWTYDDIYNAGDTLMRSLTDSVLTNGSRYQIMQEQQKFGNPVPFLYRKNDNVYYEYTPVDKYTLTVKFLPQITKDILFLKEGLATGETWSSDEYSGPSSFGQTIYIRYDFTCTNADATITINGRTYLHVYKIILMPKIRSAPTYPYNTTGEQTETWYAKGVGMIYSKKLNNQFAIFENHIRYWNVK